MMCEHAHYHDGGVSFPHSTFQAIFFVLHDADISELWDKLFCLADLQEQIHNAQCLDDLKRQAAFLSLTSAPLVPS
jgi:hypothetical protein